MRAICLAIPGLIGDGVSLGLAAARGGAVDGVLESAEGLERLASLGQKSSVFVEVLGDASLLGED